MKSSTSRTVLPSLVLGAALGVALTACARDDHADNGDTAAATSAADPAAATAAATPGHDDMAGMQGQGAGSSALDRVMKDSMAMPMTMSGNVDKDFASMMTRHHQTAIRMIDVLQQNGQAAELKALAAKMKADQQGEINTMAPFAAAAPAAAMPGHEGMAGMQGQNADSTALDRVMKDSMAMPMTMSGNVDKDFASMMTRHHKTAIKMIDAHQQSGKTAELKTLGARMKAAQQDEIKQLAQYAM